MSSAIRGKSVLRLETEEGVKSKIGFKWKSDVHLNLFQLCLECRMHLNFQSLEQYYVKMPQ